MEPSQRRQPKLEKDIFGNEYIGAKKVFSFILDVDLLASGAGHFIQAAMIRNVPHPDIVRAISDALLIVKADFWQNKIEELTPFEWKLIQALEDAEFRKKVEDLLNEARLAMGGAGHALT